LEFEIRPYKGFGPIDFGMSREQVEEKLGPPDKPFADEERNRERFFYDRFGFRVDFDESGFCWFIESWPPCEPILDGLKLAGRFDDILAKLQQLGHETAGAIDSGDFLDIGVALWREDDEREGIDSISAMTRDYLSFERKRLRQIREGFEQT